jgi:nitrous oxide reductase accessory protein NosL
MKSGRQFRKMTIANKLLLSALLLIMSLALVPAANAADQPAPQVITEAMSCGVCGMFPARFGKWQTQIIFTDGVMVPFDGCKDMFKYILDMAKYDPKHTSDDIAAIWTRDFKSGAWLDGRKAVYVIGSRVMGPMGEELVPFRTDDDAGNFKTVNGGMIKHYTDISMGEIEKLGMGGMMKKGMMKGKM